MWRLSSSLAVSIPFSFLTPFTTLVLPELLLRLQSHWLPCHMFSRSISVMAHSHSHSHNNLFDYTPGRWSKYHTFYGIYLYVRPVTFQSRINAMQSADLCSTSMAMLTCGPIRWWESCWYHRLGKAHQGQIQPYVPHHHPWQLPNGHAYSISGYGPQVLHGC